MIVVWSLGSDIEVTGNDIAIEEVAEIFDHADVITDVNQRRHSHPIS